MIGLPEIAIIATWVLPILVACIAEEIIMPRYNRGISNIKLEDHSIGRDDIPGIPGAGTQLIMRGGDFSAKEIPISQDNHYSCTINSQDYEVSKDLFTSIKYLNERAIIPNLGDLYFDEDSGSLQVYTGKKYETIRLAEPVWPTAPQLSIIKVTKCPECGAPRVLHREICPYCGVPYPLE